MNPRDLPIYELEDRVVSALRSGRRLILQAPTGSGKSTQIPQILLDRGVTGPGEIVVLQPRRLPTRLLAARVASERQSPLGQEIGYQIRLENLTSAATRIRFSTEGVLLRQILGDPSLPGVAAIVFDEFHERHLYGDITLARALEIQETARPDLIIVVMSATLETKALESYLAPCEVLTSSGRTFPVKIEYLARAPGQTPLWDLAAESVAELATRSEGDFLVFMPGSYEIHRTIQTLRQRCPEFLTLPLHGELSAADQDAAVARYDRRKIVVSTNVAETSLTIDGVRVVIDSGLARIARFDPNRGIDTLLIEKISHASADQRAGRAGRTAPGICRRLWRERDQEHRPAQALPEIRRCDLAEVVLTLKACGVADLRAFRWFEPPEIKALERAEMLLTDLGAFAAEGDITPMGRRMLTFPVHPRYARMLLAADEWKCVPQVALIAALTQGRGLLQRSTGRQMEEERERILGQDARSDFHALLRAWHYAAGMRYDLAACRALGIHAQTARQARPLYDMFLRLARQAGLEVAKSDPAPEAIARCVLLGFSDQVARRLDRGTLRCELVHGRRGHLDRESVVQDSELLVAAEVVEIEGREVNVRLNLCTAIEEDWLRELFPHAFRSENVAFYDAPNRRVAGEERTVFQDLVLRSRRTEKLPREQAAALLAAEVAAGRLVLTHWDNALEQWIIRLNRLTAWMPDLQLPRLELADRELLLQQALLGASSYREIKDRPIAHAIRSWLSAGQQELVEKFAPERVNLPNGRKFKIKYDESADPVVAIRIQDLYGVERPLTIASGRVSVVIQVLAPNHRPIQVTTDLKNFWASSYPEIKQQLQRRYPKHEWR